MIYREYTILDPHGMHARPATVLLKMARQFKSAISLKKDDKQIPAKSMLNILNLSAKCGDTITVIIDGEDEEEATLALDKFFNEEMKNF